MGEFVSNLDKEGYSYATPLKKLLLNQFGATVLGFMLSSACLANKTLNLITGLFSIFFYMFLLYTTIWDIAARDKVRIDGCRAAEDHLRGLKCALLANIPNFLLTVLTMLMFGLNILTSWEWTGAVAMTTGTVDRFWQAMYNGVVVNILPTSGLSTMQTMFSQLIYIATTIPSLIICTVGYNNGLRGKRIFPQKKKNEN